MGSSAGQKDNVSTNRERNCGDLAGGRTDESTNIRREWEVPPDERCQQREEEIGETYQMEGQKE